MLIDNFRIISQVEWRKQDSQLKILKSRYFRGQNVKMAKNIHESRGQCYVLTYGHVCDSIYINLVPRAFEERCEGQLRPW